MRTLWVLLCCAAVAQAKPQGGGSVSAADVAKTALNNGYGTNSGNIDASVLEEIFGGGGGGNNQGSAGKDTSIADNKKEEDGYGVPAGIVEDDTFDDCSFYKDYGFECVPYYQCDNGTIIEDGGGLIDIRNGFIEDIVLDPTTSKCESFLEVCCQKKDYVGVPLPTKPPKVITTPKPTTPKPPKKYQPRCGRRNVGGVGALIRIQNEDQKKEKYLGSTQFGEWPHMCAVLNKTQIEGEDVNLYVCGASLIAPGIVLTAGHCVKGLHVDKVKVRCGEWDTQQTIEPLDHQDRYAEHITIHPGFNGKNLHNDFAIIHLEAPFTLSQHIDTICLPDQFQKQYSYLPEDCFATGWGKDKFGAEGNYQVILKQVGMDLVDNYECQDRLRQTRLGTNFKLDDSFVCAGGEKGKDTCKGDGGGPLVCPTRPGVPVKEQEYIQTGIVAWGIDCGTTTPGVYANVSASLCFIDWATKCHEGSETNHFGYYGCQRWGKRNYCLHKNRQDDLNYEFESLKDSRDRETRGRLREIHQELQKVNRLVEGFKEGVLGCAYGLQNLDCNLYDYLEDDDRNGDISGLARDSTDVQGKSADGDNEHDDGTDRTVDASDVGAKDRK